MRLMPPLVLVFLLLPTLQAEALSVYLHRTARVGRGVVSLGDLAAVVADDPRQAESLRRLPLWQASGHPALVPAGLIKQHLAAAAGGQVVVVGAQTAVLPEEIAAGVELEFYTRLLEAVRSLPGIGTGRIEVQLLGRLSLPNMATLGGPAAQAGGNPPRRTDAPGEDGSAAVVDLKLELSDPGTRRGTADRYLGGLYQVSYRFEDPRDRGGTTAGTELGVGVRIRQFLPVAFAAREIRGGAVLERQDLEFRDEDVAALGGVFLGLEDRPEAYRATGPVRRGERIDPARLERHYLVRAGDTVAMVFVRPGLRVTVPGRAFSSGAAGERIEVRPREASRRFFGRVSPAGEVIIEEL